jgi:hypothetical protein
MPTTANSIITPQTPRSAAVGVNTANTTFGTSPANTGLLVTFGANGGRLTSLKAVPLETVTASNLQAYRDVGTAGASKFLFASQTGGADTVSGTDGPATVDFGYSDDNPLIGQANERIYVATGIAKSYNFIAEWADY